MIARMMTMAVAATLVLGTATFPTVTFAEMAKKDETKKETAKSKKADTAEKKALTPQQQKMKDCAGKWGDYKKEKNVKGQAEYRKFMSGCLKA